MGPHQQKLLQPKSCLNLLVHAPSSLWLVAYAVVLGSILKRQYSDIPKSIEDGT